MKKIFNIASKIILIFLITVLLLYLFEIKVMREKYFNFFGYSFFEVLTGSMEDTINIGDLVVVKITKDIEVNDIIAFKQEGNLIIHRVINIKDNEIITKGDANNEEDTPIKEEQIIGKECFKIKKFKIWKEIVIIILLVTMLLICLV